MKASKVTPIHRRAIVKLDPAVESISAGGIILTPVTHQSLYQGRVVSVAADCKDVRVGDAVILERICADKLGRTPVALDDEDETANASFVTVAERDIICILEPAA